MRIEVIIGITAQSHNKNIINFKIKSLPDILEIEINHPIDVTCDCFKTPLVNDTRTG